MSESSQPSDQNTSIEGETHLIFLPGLHGSAELFEDLLAQLKLQEISFKSTLISYPTDSRQSYKNLFHWLCSELNIKEISSDTRVVIIAESFSTPLALMLADKFTEQISGLIIGGGFCASPAYSSFALLPLRPLFILTPPRSAVKHFLTGPESDDELVAKVRSAVKKVSSKTLSHRMRSILTLEESTPPAIPKTPVLVLQAEDDAVIPWKIQNQLEIHLPHAKIRWLVSPHLIFQVHPETCASHIAAFISKI